MHDTPRMASRPHRTLVSVALLLALLVAGCGSEQSTTDQPESSGANASSTTSATTPAVEALPAAVQTLDIEGTEYAFDLQTGDDSALRPGWTEVTFANTGAEAHQVMFARLKDGVDLAQLGAAAGDDSSGSRAIEYVDMLGGVSYIGPGQTVEAMVDLPEGVVLAMCYVPDPHGVAHALSGMTTTLTVGGDAGPGVDAAATSAPADTPASGGDDRVDVVQGTITMGPDGYDVPSPLPAGWYRVVNDDDGQAGEGLHELSILGLEEQLDPDGLDQLLGDLATNAAPSVPLVALGGMGALSAGFDSYLYLDLEPGHYLAVDFMPDPGDPRPHLLDGYVTPFQP